MSVTRNRRWIVRGLCLVLLSPGAAAGVDGPDAADILKRCDRAESFESVYSEARQVIITTSGQERTLVIRSWAIDNGDKQLVEYLAPADIKGQKILLTEDGDNIWMYNPETRRTRKLGSHMKKKKMMGSDFTYEDQSAGKISEKYTGTLLREEQQAGVDCFVVELKPTPKGPSYDKVIAWINRASFVILRVDYYQDDEDAPFKRLTTEDFRVLSNRHVPHKITMTNLEDKTQTTHVITRFQHGVEIPPSIFESRNLEG